MRAMIMIDDGRYSMKKAWIIAIILMLAVIFTGCGNGKDELLEKVKEKAEKYELEVSSISTSSVTVLGDPLYHYTLYCNGFGKYSNEDMIDIARSLDSFWIDR